MACPSVDGVQDSVFGFLDDLRLARDGGRDVAGAGRDLGIGAVRCDGQVGNQGAAMPVGGRVGTDRLGLAPWVQRETLRMLTMPLLPALFAEAASAVVVPVTVAVLWVVAVAVPGASSVKVTVTASRPDDA